MTLNELLKKIEDATGYTFAAAEDENGSILLVTGLREMDDCVLVPDGTQAAAPMTSSGGGTSDAWLTAIHERDEARKTRLPQLDIVVPGDTECAVCGIRWDEHKKKDLPHLFQMPEN